MSNFGTIFVLAFVVGIVGFVMMQSSTSGTMDYSIGLALFAGCALAGQYALVGLAARYALREHDASKVDAT